MQEPERHHCTGPEAGLGGLRHGAQLLIDMVEQGGDKLRGGHGLLRAQQGFTLLSSVEEVHNQCKMASEYYWFVRDSHHRFICSQPVNSHHIALCLVAYLIVEGERLDQGCTW